MLLLLTLVSKFDVTLITGWNKANCHGSVQLDQIEWMVLNMIQELEVRCTQPRENGIEVNMAISGDWKINLETSSKWYGQKIRYIVCIPTYMRHLTFCSQFSDWDDPANRLVSYNYSEVDQSWVDWLSLEYWQTSFEWFSQMIPCWHKIQPADAAIFQCFTACFKIFLDTCVLPWPSFLPATHTNDTECMTLFIIKI